MDVELDDSREGDWDQDDDLTAQVSGDSESDALRFSSVVRLTLNRHSALEERFCLVEPGRGRRVAGICSGTRTGCRCSRSLGPAKE